MGEILERLLGLLPFVLGILWLLNRSNRRRRNTQAGKQQGKPAPDRSSLPDRSIMPELSAGRKILDTVLNRKPDSIRVELDKQEPSATSPAPQAPSRVYQQEETLRLVPGQNSMLSRKPVSGKRPVRTEGIYARINSLSPVKQGLLWSFILSPPPSAENSGVNDQQA